MAKTSVDLRLGTLRFDPVAGELRSDSDRATLRPQTAQVLALLAEQAGQLVTKNALMDAVWRDTHVTDDSLVQCVSEIRKALDGSGAAVVTIPRKGYRLDLQGDQPQTAPVQNRRWLVMGIAAVLVLALGFAVWATRPRAPVTPISIAVLPFRNMSGDESQAYFSNGVAEDLIVSLSNISDLRILSRGTSFSAAQGDRDMRDIAADLRVHYLLDGSVRRVGDTLRVSAALVEGETGANIWAERYEGTPNDILEFQDDLVNALVRTLSVRLSGAERARLGVRGTTDVAAFDAYLRGRELENLYTETTNRAAEDALRDAIRHDPDFALAYAHLSQVYSFRVENNWTDQRVQTIALAFENAERAVALDPLLPFAHFALGRLYTRSFSPDEARVTAAYERAIELDPNYDDAYVFLANLHIFSGRAEQALPLIAEAFQRNPLPPYWYYLAEGMANYFLGNYETAEAALVRARDQNPTAPYPYRFLIASYARLGNLDEADWMAMEYEALGRIATVQALLDSASIQDPTYRNAFAQGFRLAGLPED